VDGGTPERLSSLLDGEPRVRQAYLAFEPPPPPATDSEAATPDFRDLQSWLDPFPGVDLAAAAAWPGGLGAEARIVDVEYGWDPLHEDLEEAPETVSWGLDTRSYAFHGNSVLGMILGGWNQLGVDGALPWVEVRMVSPFLLDGTYSVAAAIAGAAQLLEPGDVLLIEQQAWVDGTFGPVSVEPAVWDAIEDAVARGIVVVEPGGNGGLDLDEPSWGGWFDRSVQDSGSILVGGGAPPGAREPRAWSPRGSSYGTRLDVQGWYGEIVTASGLDEDGYADLWAPDATRAYTKTFGGTSGASPMAASAVAALQGIRRAQGWGVLTPAEARGALVGVGTPQEGERWIGPQPDLRRLLRTWATP
jgi:hypothetical protein